MSMVQKYPVQFPKLCQSSTRLLVLVIIFTTVAVVGFQNFNLSPGNGPLYQLSQPGQRTLPSDSEKSIHLSHVMENGMVYVPGESHNEPNEIDMEWDDFDIDRDGEHDNEFSVDLWNGIMPKKVKDPYGRYITVEKTAKEEKYSSMDMDGESGRGFISIPSKNRKTNFSLDFGKVKDLDNSSLAPSPLPYPGSSYIDKDIHVRQYKDSSDFVVNVVLDNSLSGDRRTETIVRSGETTASESFESTGNCKAKDRAAKKRIKQDVMSTSDMNHLLSKNHGSSCSMVRLSQKIKGQVEN